MSEEKKEEKEKEKEKKKVSFLLTCVRSGFMILKKTCTCEMKAGEIYREAKNRRCDYRWTWAFYVAFAVAFGPKHCSSMHHALSTCKLHG